MNAWVVYLFFGLVTVIGFLILYHQAVIARRILNNAKMPSRAILHVAGI
jgi:hypothetical protein